MSDPLLSSLCTICHVRPHKYRCPRCSALTCSLPCIKRHKQWAQCNGLRDPTVYIKQKDLATPKGIDHDYNYLTSIERELDNAEKDATSRGVVLQEPSTRKNNMKKGGAQLEAALGRCGVVVAKAPKGMTRSKQNETLVTKRKNLVWTVEWVHPDGSKALGRCPEDQSIAKAYTAHIGTLDPHRPMKKRKKNHEELENAPINTAIINNPIQERVLSNGDDITHERDNPLGQELAVNGTPNETTKRSREKEKNEVGTRQDENEALEIPPQRRQEQRHPEKEGPDNERIHEEIDPRVAPTVHANDSQSKPPARSGLPTTTSETTQPASKISLMFHLHHPSLPSKQPVLISLSPDSNLATSLTNRLVLEFPTIYVLHRQPEDRLPDEFISEEDFFATAKKEMNAEVGVGDGLIEGYKEAEARTREPLEEGEVDEGRLFEVLGKDLRDITGSL